ncbi:hypothetical protein J4G08_06660 [Candidatus Poribacteria bacterium]|nr:hypothetical protein [Candidatus Poribacteria bacterium]
MQARFFCCQGKRLNEDIMGEKDKKRDPMPPPDTTPEEIGEFWDTHSLADYLDETHEVEFQVNLESRLKHIQNVAKSKRIKEK